MRGISDTTLVISNPKLRNTQNHNTQKTLESNTTSKISIITTSKPKHAHNRVNNLRHTKRLAKTIPNITQNTINLTKTNIQRNLKISTYKQIPSTNLKHPSSKNPYTRVCGKRRSSYKNSTQNKLSTSKEKLPKKIKTKRVVFYKTNSTPYINKFKPNNPNTLPCPKPNKNALTNFKIKISKLDRTHIYMYKERNNNASTTHILNTKSQGHGLNTQKKNTKDLLNTQTYT